MSEFDGIYSDLTRQVINAAIEVHTELGCGLKEGIEHVSNTRATAYKLQNSETPRSESNTKKE